MGAQFKNISAGEAVVLQWVIFPDRPRAATADDEEKVADHTFHAIARLRARGDESHGMIHDLYSVLSSVHSHGAHFRRRLVPDPCGQTRAAVRNARLSHLPQRCGVFGAHGVAA